MKIIQLLGTWLVLLCSTSAFAGHHEGGYTSGGTEIGLLTMEQKIGLAGRSAVKRQRRGSHSGCRQHGAARRR